MMTRTIFLVFLLKLGTSPASCWALRQYCSSSEVPSFNKKILLVIILVIKLLARSKIFGIQNFF